MQTDIQTTAALGVERAARRSKPSGPPVLLFIALWVVLIAGGAYGAVWYAGQLKAEMTADIERQTAVQIAAMQQDYQSRIAALEESFGAEIGEVEKQVAALNELLTFTKDNANAKTDNSNMLYTQINEVKNRLAELQKQLDVLK